MRKWNEKQKRFTQTHIRDFLNGKPTAMAHFASDSDFHLWALSVNVAWDMLVLGDLITYYVLGDKCVEECTWKQLDPNESHLRIFKPKNWIKKKRIVSLVTAEKQCGFETDNLLRRLGECVHFLKVCTSVFRTRWNTSFFETNKLKKNVLHRQWRGALRTKHALCEECVLRAARIAWKWW